MSSPRSARLIVGVVLFAFLTQSTAAQFLFLPLPLPTPPPSSAANCSASQLASSPKLDAAVQQWVRTGSGRLRVIVSAQSGLLSAVRTLLIQTGATLLGDLPGINAVVADVTRAALSTTACASSVATISIDAVVRTSGWSADDETPAPYSLRATLGLPQDTPAGSGIGVAVIDSGIANSADLAGRITSFFDLTQGLALPRAPLDEYGHGTHVAGLIAGSAALSNGAYEGLGPQVRLVGMKVLDENGAGRTSDVIRAVELATLLRPVLGIQVINLSLGHPIYEAAARDPLVRAVEAAVRSGIVVVAAAGNDGFNRTTGEIGYGGINSPGNAPSALTVGAVMTQETNARGDDRIAPYSSRGPSWYDAFAKPDIVAPGHALVSNAAPGSYLAEHSTAHVGTSYMRLSGTSMATAVASGAVALVLEANRRANPGAPALTPNAVKAILQYSALRVRDAAGVEYDTLTQGVGALNAAGAIELARAIDTRQPIGTPWLTAGLSATTRIASDVWTWAQRLLWRTEVLWGPTIDSNQLAWLPLNPWGANNLWDSHIVWGTEAVWGDNTSSWSTHIVWGSNAVGATSDDGDHIVWGTADTPDNTEWCGLADPACCPDCSSQ